MKVKLFKVPNCTNSKKLVQSPVSSGGFLFILLFFCPFQSEHQTHQEVLNSVCKGKIICVKCECKSKQPIVTQMKIKSIVQPALNNKVRTGDPWVAQRFSSCLWPRARSWSPGIESNVRLPAWSLLLFLPVSLPPPSSMSIINK